jgi:hypothetical protein
MRNWLKFLGIIALVAVIGFSMVGCGSLVPPNYYNLGDVSEENCALIRVNNTSSSGSGSFSHYSNYVSIDGQGDHTFRSPWKGKSVPGLSDGDAIVRVTPGTHTFVGAVYRSSGSKESTVSLTYDVEAGKGYSFSFDGVADNTRAFVMIIHEHDIDEKGKFSLLGRRVAEETAWL